MNSDQKVSDSPQGLQELDQLLGELIGSVVDANQLDFLKQKSVIGKYSIKSSLGSGGQAICFLGYDADLDRDVVIKLYSKALSEDRRQQILREGRALARINSPSVAKCYGVETLDGRPFLVLEYVDGQSLNEWAKNRVVTSDQAMELVSQIADALESVHKAGLVHLDLKPGNVIVKHDQSIVLIDFGLSRSDGDEQPTNIAGTPSFLPPEVINGDDIDHRADIYGVGSILYFLLTDRAPVEGESKSDVLAQVAKGGIDYLPLSGSGISPRAREVCERCLSSDAAQRYQNVNELKSALRSLNGKYYRIAVACAVILTLLGSVIAFGNPFGANTNLSAEGPSDAAVVQQAIDQVVPAIRTQEKFQITFELSQTGTKIHAWDSKERDIQLDLQNNSIYDLRITPEQSCYFAMFSFEQAPGSRNINHVDLINSNDYDEIRPANKPWIRSLEPDALTTEGKAEYLWVVATSAPLKAKEMKEEMNRNLSGNPINATMLVESNRTRGLRSDSGSLNGSQMLIPYTVVPASK